MKNISKIIQLSKQFRGLFFLLSILILLTATLQQVTPIVFKLIIDEIFLNSNNTSNSEKIIWLIGILFFSNLLGQFIESVSNRLSDHMAGNVRKFLIETFYRKLFTLPQKYFDSKVSGKILNQLNRGILSITEFLKMASAFILPALLQALLSIIILSYFNIYIGLLALLIFPFYISISHYSTKKWGSKELKKNSIEDLNKGRMQEVISNIKLVKTFSTQRKEWDFVSNNLKESNAIYAEQSQTYHILNFIRNLGLESVIIIISLLVFNWVLKNEMTIGEMVLILQLLNQIRMPLFGMSFILERIQEAEAGSKEFFDVLTLDSTEDFDAKRKPSRIKDPRITFNDVSFEYENDKSVISDVTLELENNKTYALVGHSGAGKTTLVNLILGFYEPTKGSLSLNGVDYSKMKHRDIRDNISLVFQDNELFSSSVRENVSYGLTKITDTKIIEALKKANAYDFVMELPNGLDSEIGERGVKLSGGQKQRIQIARAIINDSPILILDEATSSLDAKSEKLVQDALENLFKSKLVIIIAHRFSTIQNANEILVLDKGKIIDQGNPGSLAKKKGIYSELLRFQIEGNQKLLDKYELY